VHPTYGNARAASLCLTYNSFLFQLEAEFKRKKKPRVNSAHSSTDHTLQILFAARGGQSLICAQCCVSERRSADVRFKGDTQLTSQSYSSPLDPATAYVREKFQAIIKLTNYAVPCELYTGNKINVTYRAGHSQCCQHTPAGIQNMLLF
jgi:hypothetical protein